MNATSYGGSYLVGTGNTGAAATFLTLGLGYGAIMMATSMVYRLPPPNFVPDSVREAQEAATLRPRPKVGGGLCVGWVVCVGGVWCVCVVGVWRVCRVHCAVWLCGVCVVCVCVCERERGAGGRGAVAPPQGGW